MFRKHNRTRYKNRKPAPAAPAPQQTLPAPEPDKGSTLTKSQAVAEILSALDGYSNAAAFLGEDSPLLASGTFRRSLCREGAAVLSFSLVHLNCPAPNASARTAN